MLKNEVNKLTLMYDGDKDRDATSKIRGFLFQDYVTIMCLLTNQVEYVCSEFLEDIDVFFQDNTFEVIQVKYYPKTTPDIKEISTDLYYQFLRLQMLGSSLTVKPSLYIYRTQPVKKPSVDDMKEYIGLGTETPPSIEYPDYTKVTNLLKTEIYSKRKKEEQKTECFKRMASVASLTNFINDFCITKNDSIDLFKSQLMEKLSTEFPNPDATGNTEHWKLILLGLAISYVQQRYLLENPQFDQIKMDKKEFYQYMSNSVQTKTELSIASYLVGIVCEEYDEIIEHNDLSTLQNCMLNLIFHNTVQWIQKIGATESGQFQLLNTFSKSEVNIIDQYHGKSTDERLIRMAECKQTFHSFLKYLWKILINIGQKEVRKAEEIKSYKHVFDLTTYIVSSVDDYVCLRFPEDKNIDHSVIVPPAEGEFTGIKRKIIERMIKLSPKPDKWFFKNDSLKRGKNVYDYSTANIIETPTIVDLGENSFYIECMDCIGIDEGEWNITETCDDCIFTEKCVKEE